MYKKSVNSWHIAVCPLVNPFPQWETTEMDSSLSPLWYSWVLIYSLMPNSTHLQHLWLFSLLCTLLYTQIYTFSLFGPTLTTVYSASQSRYLHRSMIYPTPFTKSTQRSQILGLSGGSFTARGEAPGVCSSRRSNMGKRHWRGLLSQITSRHSSGACVCVCVCALRVREDVGYSSGLHLSPWQPVAPTGYQYRLSHPKGGVYTHTHTQAH